MSPTVFVIDDDEAMRDSLWQLLDTEEIPVEIFASGQAFLDAFDLARRGCIVADVRMPGLSGLEVMQKLRERQCDIPVIIITAHGDVPLAVAALKAGATDFFEKPLDNQALLDSIKLALERVRTSGADGEELAALRKRYATLTAREREVMAMAVDGQPNKLIADRLGTSPRTIEVHRSHILGKMQARNLAELVRMSLRLTGFSGPTI